MPTAKIRESLGAYHGHQLPEIRHAANHLLLALDAVEMRKLSEAYKRIAEADRFIAKSNDLEISGVVDLRDEIARIAESMRPPTRDELAERAKRDDKQIGSVPFPLKKGEVDDFPPDLGYLRNKKKR